MSGRGRRVAIVHDWLTGMRGGEKVLEVICERFPGADLFTLLHVRGAVSPVIERRPVHTSALQWLPGVRRYYRACLPLFPILIEQFDLDGFDLVISTSHCAAKAVVAPATALHICYCHTPMRYAWDQFEAYFGPQRVGRTASRLLAWEMAALARWDRDTAGRVSRYLTNSQHVAGRIRRYYNREASVVYPPVDTAFFHPDASIPSRSALIVSALVPYKRLDVAIDACRLAGVPLRIVGEGPERARLERGATGTVRFLGRLSDEEVRAEYRRAGVIVMPGEEDFGIVPVEAQACGRPVVALGRGGALESIVEGETGFFVEEQAPQAFADAIGRALAFPFEPAAIRRHAERFSRERFGDEFDAIVAAELSASGGGAPQAARARESTLEREGRDRGVTTSGGGAPRAQ